MDTKKPLSQWSLHDVEVFGWQATQGIFTFFVLLYVAQELFFGGSWRSAAVALAIVLLLWSPNLIRRLQGGSQ